MTMRGAVLSLSSSRGALNGTFTVYTEEEDEDPATSPSPTESSSHLTPDDVAVVVGFFSFLLFLLFLVMLLVCIYRKDPRKCCKICSCQRPCGDMDAPPQYHSSRQTLVGSACLDQTHIINDSPGQQAGQLFFVGLPSSYSLPSPPPRLPSYESVRKKDRQRQIHMMIADRFGLNGPIVSEPPPTYEETIRQSVELPYNVLSSAPDLPSPPGFYANPGLDASLQVTSEVNSSTPPV